jgi:hypothetical protein
VLLARMVDVLLGPGLVAHELLGALGARARPRRASRLRRSPARRGRSGRARALCTAGGASRPLPPMGCAGAAGRRRRIYGRNDYGGAGDAKAHRASGQSSVRPLRPLRLRSPSSRHRLLRL